MKHFTMMIQSILVLVFGMTQVSFLYAETLGSQQAEGVSHAPDTLVMVEKVIAYDADGEAHTLYQEEEGRIYRLDNVNQVVHDLNARGIKSKGSFHSLQAVLAERVFVMGKNNQPYPAERSEVGIPETYRLAVENLRVTKDRITAIYTTNCNDLSI
ncbi:MAG: hypothetical protein B6D70_06380 [gamma proteobacterium symbiont of Stewartia floridana]|nr:hypothetical protein [Candidatus Thiodiazotropha taylori]RLW52642.1 MAG: hypothetical protein B6D76_14760 [gamma proteobacterium symbiont of Stewartia floridana]MCG7896556.1 hypothetical protein [Candidatus Thiodiazotropha taylori]MCG7907496.1 hypothetical protein [Candidatus Thiodiazotropha taylori]MCG7911706.1 hypothetical protein [Candidatus Thiodiazotropha taylori]